MSEKEIDLFPRKILDLGYIVALAFREQWLLLSQCSIEYQPPKSVLILPYNDDFWYSFKKKKHILKTSFEKKKILVTSIFSSPMKDKIDVLSNI